MDIKKALEYAVVLAPAILSILVLVMPIFKQWLVSGLENHVAVELAKEIVVHAAFFGTAATAYFGFAHHPWAGVVAMLWFAIAVRIANSLAVKAKQLSERKSNA